MTDANYMRNSARVKAEAAAKGEMAFDGRPYDMVDWEYEASLSCLQQYWRAKWNLKPRGPMWLPQIIRMTWYLTVINFVLGIHGQIDGDLGGPFFYSRTSCCGESGTPKNLPPIYDIHYPDTFNNFHVNTTYMRACDVPLLDSDDPYWSHSAYCPNWDYVRAFTQKLGAGRSMTLTMMSLFCMPIGAGFADKRGRKPMFVFGFMLGVKSLFLNLVSSTPWSIHTDPDALILYVSGILSGMGSGCGPVSMAMLVDLIPGDMREQGFPMMNLFGIPGALVVFFIAYSLLHKHLTTYTLFWSISLSTDFICLAFLVTLLPETMPDSLKKDLDKWDFFPGTYYWQAVKIIFKYPLLIGISICIMLWSFSGRGMGSVSWNQLWSGPLKFRQEEGLIPWIIGMLCGIPANIIATIVIPRVGVWPAIFFGSFFGLFLGMMSNVWPVYWMNYYACWTGTHCGNGDWGTPLFIAKWGGTLGGTVLGTFVGAISGPAGTAMISMQVKQTEQASIQAAFNLVGALSGMYAPLYFTNNYFDTTCIGWHCIRFAFVGFSIQLLASCLYVASWFVDRYLHILSKARYIMPKHGVEGVHGMSTLDVQRAKMVGTIPGRLNPQNQRAEPARLSRVMRRGGEHELADDSERARSVNRDDAQSGQELQPLLDKSQ